MPDSTELVSVTEAARLLGIHPNTVRKRIKKGAYTAEWAPSEHGPQQLIPRAQLDGSCIHPPTDNTGDGSTSSLTFIAPPAPPPLELVVEKALNPFVAKLEETLKENGRLEAELRAAREELAALRAKPAAPWWRRLLFGSAA
jgi:hypothetical protein